MGLEFGKRLKQLRENRRLSVKETASMIGVPITTYRDWEYGKDIKGEPYNKISEVLGVSLNELLTGSSQSETGGLPGLIARIENDLFALKRELGNRVNSQSNGSSAGKESITNPLPPHELRRPDV